MEQYNKLQNQSFKTNLKKTKNAPKVNYRGIPSSKHVKLNYKLDYCWVVFFKTEYHTFYFATLFSINKRKSITCAPGISSAFNIKDPFPFSSSMVPKEIFIKSFA